MPEKVLYQVGWRGGSMAEPLPLRKALERGQARLKGKGPFRQKLRGENSYGPDKGLPATMTRVDHQLRNVCKLGDAVWVKSERGRTFVFRKVKVYVEVNVPPCPDPYATPAVKGIWGVVQRLKDDAEAKFGDLDFVYLGIYNCRHIAGSTRWSQHSWRNALDWAVHRPGGAIDMEAMDWIVQRVRKVSNCETLWRVANHYDHNHVGGCPLRTGTPSCA